MEDKKLYDCYYQQDTSDRLDVEELFYLIKNYQLVEIVLDDGMYIRQWNEPIDNMIEADNGIYELKSGVVYFVDTNGATGHVISVRDGRGVEGLKERIDDCYHQTKKALFEYLDDIARDDEDASSCIIGAIEDYYRKYVEKNEDWTPSYGELAYYTELEKDYILDEKIKRGTII